MVTTKTIHGIYDDEELLVEGAKKLRSERVRIKDVFSPFPIHGIDSVLGIPRTRIAICSFIYGITGTSLAILMTWYMMTGDWPTDIGGKPSFWYYMQWPAFIPVTFELTVFCAAHGMAITFLLRSWLLPGVSPKNPDPRTTDNKFLVLVETTSEDESRIVSMFRETGASEVNVI
ncbi:MAG TPA: DUF3341 domain-containing protein [Bacteroidia bacterium]|nr:DUF3341 domain-containing protein [Bacteroidia bacterium]